MLPDGTSISARDLGKSYRLRGAGPRPTTLAEVALARLRHPLRRAGRESFWALRDVSFDVRIGEAVGIIGRNGAGKSTLLKILSRITEPSAGEVRIKGRVGCLLEVGTGFHPELTGRENIFLNGAILGMKRREIAGHFDSIVEFSGVSRFLDTPVKRYSSGMSVRLAFAVAAHLEPEIFIVDEVLAVGDAEFQRRCLGKMSEVAREHARTVLFVSHNMAAIEALCSRCIVLEGGTIRFDGTPKKAIEHYVSLISADIVNGAEVDLTTRERSASHPRPVLRRVGLRGPMLEPIQTIRMGDGVSVVIEVDGLHDMPGAFVGLDLRSELDQAIATFHGRMKPPRRSRNGGAREEVVFDLGGLPLMPGRYWFSIGVWDPNRSGLADRVERAISFEVAPADVYGSGYDVQSREGAVFADFEWEVRPVDNGPSSSATEAVRVPPAT